MDEEEGGEGGREGGSDTLGMVCHTLGMMGRGGVHDHVGGGFHRYSVDELWHGERAVRGRTFLDGPRNLKIRIDELLTHYARGMASTTPHTLVWRESDRYGAVCHGT